MHPKTRALRVFVAVVLAAGPFLPAASARADENVASPKPAAAGARTDGTAQDEKPATAPAEPGESAQDELSRRATDPTASPLTFGFINDVTTSYRDLEDGTPIDENGYQFKLQPVIPFKAWGVANIFRMTVPYQVSGPSPEGLGDITVFDLVVLPQSWGQLALGADMQLAPGTADDDGTIAIGPAVGVVVPLSKRLNVGAFTQNLFGKGTAISQLQPIIAYQLGGGWALSAGDLQLIYDWDAGRFVSLPIGAQIGVVTPVAGQPFRFSLNPQYNFADVTGAGRFKVVFTVALLAPLR